MAINIFKRCEKRLTKEAMMFKNVNNMWCLHVTLLGTFLSLNGFGWPIGENKLVTVQKEDIYHFGHQAYVEFPIRYTMHPITKRSLEREAEAKVCFAKIRGGQYQHSMVFGVFLCNAKKKGLTTENTLVLEGEPGKEWIAYLYNKKVTKNPVAKVFIQEHTGNPDTDDKLINLVSLCNGRFSYNCTILRDEINGQGVLTMKPYKKMEMAPEE